MCFLLIFSGSLICGLYSEFRSVRNMAGSMAEENIHYQRYDIYDGVMERKADGSEDTGGRFETFRYRALWEEQGSKIHIWITGVNAVYLTQYETVLADISDEKTASRMMTEEGKPEAFDQDGQLMELLEDENFDGILMPDGYASPGETIILNVDGAEIPFTVYGGCLSNDFDRLDAYVSRAYLEKQLGREGACNTVYYLEGAREAAPGSPAMSQTKEDVWQETWRHAVQGTENVELLIWMILICCILAVCTCLVMSCSDNRRMLACLQGMGTSRRVLVKISNLQAAWNVLCVVLPVIGLTYVLTRAVCYLTMGAAYAIVTPIEVSPSRFVLLFAAWFAIYLAVQLFLVRRETKDGRCVEILRK